MMDFFYRPELAIGFFATLWGYSICYIFNFRKSKEKEKQHNIAEWSTSILLHETMTVTQIFEEFLQMTKGGQVIICKGSKSHVFKNGTMVEITVSEVEL